MSIQRLSNFILLPELKLVRVENFGRFEGRYYCTTRDTVAYCPRCANPSQTIYDHRLVRVKDAPIRGSSVVLFIRKRRLMCKPCGKPFTEYVSGIRKGKQHTERYQNSILWACENFTDLKRVRRAYRCSAYFLYKAYYKALERKRLEKLSYPWPKIIGIDEHAFRRNPKTARIEFASMIVDHVNRKVRELVHGKCSEDLKSALENIPGRENVRYVTLDLCDPFKNFARDFFPNAELVADKFHVLRLLSPSLLRHRKEITGDRASARARKLLLMSSQKLDVISRITIRKFLEQYPELGELYSWKERLHGFYRIRGFDRAAYALNCITDEMSKSLLPEIKTLRRTLMKWRHEILNYFKTGLTNARVEGFNNKAKLVKRRGYGYKSFENYRLKVLNACC